MIENPIITDADSVSEFFTNCKENIRPEEIQLLGRGPQLTQESVNLNATSNILTFRGAFESSCHFPAL